MQRAFKPGLDDTDQEIANCVLDDMRNYADMVGRPHEMYAACGSKLGVDPGILRNRLVRNQTRWSYAEIALLLEKGILSSRTVQLLKSLVDVPEAALEGEADEIETTRYLAVELPHGSTSAIVRTASGMELGKIRIPARALRRFGGALEQIFNYTTTIARMGVKGW